MAKSITKNGKPDKEQRRVIAKYRFAGAVRGAEGWVRLSQAQRASMGFEPNHGAYHDADRAGAIVCRRMRNGNWAVAARGVKYLVESKAAGRIDSGHVVLVSAGDYEVINVMPVGDFVERLGEPTERGPWGPYWWVNDRFEFADNNNPF